jgi:PEP-CTERM motif
MRKNASGLLFGLLGSAILVASTTASQATVFNLSLSGDIGGFSESQIDFSGLHFDEFTVGLTGLDGSNAITVSQGDTINNTVTFNGEYTIPGSQVRTDILQFLFGSSFPSENTGVNGEFNFYDGATLVATFDYGSTTGGALASFAAVFDPIHSTGFTFDSFTNDFTINELATSATLDSSSFEYALVSNLRPVPEPATLVLFGSGLLAAGVAKRRKNKNKSV